MDSFCTKVCSSSEELIQPAYRFLDIPTLFCTRCRWFFDQSLVQPAVTAIAGVENLPLMAFTCESHKVTDFAYPDSPAVSERESTRFVESNSFTTNNAAPNAQSQIVLSTPLLLYLKRQLFSAAKEQQRAIPNFIPLTSKAVEMFRRRIESGAQTVMVYEDPEQQRQARRVIDFERVFQYSRESFISAAENGQESFSEEEAVMIGLMRWFKCDFFSWFRAKCEFCQSTSMKNGGQVGPSPEETTAGWASRTELYECNDCKRITRFPRYNNPSKLMTSRTGRCGEFANAFCLICRSLGFDARYVLDFTDHVWVEVWIPSLNRFVHADPCERALDTPLMYETGWSKKLTHVLSFSRYGVVDASPRYSRKLSEVILRRNSEVVTESLVDTVIAAQDAKLEGLFLQKLASQAQGSQAVGPLTTVSWFDMLPIGESRFEAATKRDISSAVMKERKTCLSGEMHALRFLATKSWKVEEMQGRISGDLDWKLSRGEAGTDPSGASSAGDETKSKQTLTAPPQLKWLMDGVVLSSSVACSGSMNVLVSTCGDHESGSQLQTKLRKIFDFSDSIVSKFDCRILVGNIPFMADSSGFCGAAIAAESCAYLEKGLDYVLPNDSAVETCSIPVANTIAGSVLNDMVIVSCRNKENSVSKPIVRDEFNRLTASFAPSAVLSGLALHSNISDAKSKLYAVNNSEITDTLIAQQARYVTNAPPMSTYKLTKVEGFICPIACDMIIALPGETREQLIDKARDRCLDSPYLLGFSVLGASPSGASGSVGECVLFFSDSGFPLKAMPSHEVYLKSHDLSQRSYSNPTIAYSKSYHYMGGAHHGDTSYFDSTTFLTSLSDCDGAWMEHVGNLKRIDVWAGRDIVNGLQFVYARDDVEISTPLLSSCHDNPTVHSFAIGPNDKIARVAVNYGSLVSKYHLYNNY